MYHTIVSHSGFFGLVLKKNILIFNETSPYIEPVRIEQPIIPNRCIQRYHVSM
jgi:hypothetical protein